MAKILVNTEGKALMSADRKVYKGANVSIKTQGAWQGTPVPNTGTVGNVYLNTNLSVEEVNALLDKITFNVDGYQEFFVANESGSKSILGMDVGVVSGGQMLGYVIAALNEDGMIPIFSSAAEDATEMVLGVAFTGWYSDFNGVFEFNDTAIAEMSGMLFGSQNDLLTSLFSSTPFTRLEDKTVNLTGEYDGSTISITPSEEELKEYNIELKPYIQEQKIPLHFKIQLPNPLLQLINNTKSCSYLYAHYPYDILSPLISNNDTKDVKYFNYMFYDCSDVTTFPKLNTSNGTNFEGMYKDCRSATEFPLINTGEGYNFSAMYYNCHSATEFPLINTGEGANFSAMYRDCYSATSFPKIDTYRGTNFSEMYRDCRSATEFPLTKTLYGTNFSGMYRDCRSATEFPLINTSKGTDFSYMYVNCRSATEFPLIDTSKGTNFESMYGSCRSATEFPLIDTSKGTNFSGMYGSCTSATSFPELDTSNGTDFSHMYQTCSSATSIPALDTSNGTDFNWMYRNCNKTKKIDISHYNISSTSRVDNWCSQCYSLTAVIIRSFGENYVLDNSSFTSCYKMLGKTDATYNPNGEQGYVYVPRNMVDILNAKTNWSELQFKALEDYTKDGTTTGEFDDEKAGIVYDN